ncbi:hypothetical protein Taro_023267 [Colocasia esculenta]|uniref:Uncharacterized protein n=1 Tax=Colocasia esculenta TaxID=4460 RepID=A0A843VAW5_COLES|nr:hypothetical protein [Colocasia esculenta]
MYMDVDDMVFVPLSDVYMDLHMCLDVCRFMTPEDLNVANGGLVTTCGVSMRASAGGPGHGDKAPTGVEDLSRHVRPM